MKRVLKNACLAGASILALAALLLVQIAAPSALMRHQQRRQRYRNG